MGENLAENLATNLAENLAEDLADAGGDWRSSVSGLTHDWRYGYGETITGGNLQTWTDNVSGLAVSAASAAQRFTPNLGGWLATGANLCYLWTATPGALATLYSAANPFTWHQRVNVTLTGTFTRYITASSSSTRFTAQTIQSTGEHQATRVVGGTVTTGAGGLTASTTYTLSQRYDPTDTGSEWRAYLDGSEFGTPISSGSQDTHLWFLLGAATFTGSTFLNYTTTTFYEVIGITEAQTPAQIAAVHANLASDYP